MINQMTINEMTMIMIMMKQIMKKKQEEKPLHGQHPKRIDDSVVGQVHSHKWLRTAGFKIKQKDESLITNNVCVCVFFFFTTRKQLVQPETVAVPEFRANVPIFRCSQRPHFPCCFTVVPPVLYRVFTYSFLHQKLTTSHSFARRSLIRFLIRQQLVHAHLL